MTDWRSRRYAVELEAARFVGGVLLLAGWAYLFLVLALLP